MFSANIYSNVKDIFDNRRIYSQKMSGLIQ